MILFDHNLSDLQSIKMYKCICLRLILFLQSLSPLIKWRVTNSCQPIREQADSVLGYDGSWSIIAHISRYGSGSPFCLPRAGLDSLSV